MKNFPQKEEVSVECPHCKEGRSVCYHYEKTITVEKPVGIGECLSCKKKSVLIPKIIYEAKKIVD